MRNEIIKIIIDVTDDDTILKEPNIDLIENDILDSLAFINLISTLEKMYNIEIEPTEVAYETWTKLDNIVAMVEELIKK